MKIKEGKTYYLPMQKNADASDENNTVMQGADFAELVVSEELLIDPEGLINHCPSALQLKIGTLFYGFMKDARRQSFMDWLEEWDLTYDDYEEIQAYFKGLGIELGK